MGENRQEASHQLLCEIVSCPEIAKAGGDDGHPCANIVSFQDRLPGPFQPPTPWVGRVSQAPIQFIGSNPNISGREHYPTTDWPEGDLIAFFDGAFEGKEAQIRDGIRPRKADGSYGGWVRTWAGVRGRARELLDREPVPGRDYAMTEIVHCRSWNEIGVEDARSHCADLYLERILEQSAARVVVGLGAHVGRWLQERWGLGEKRVSPLTIGGQTRMVALLPHPTRFGPKTFASVMPDELDALKLCAQADH